MDTLEHWDESDRRLRAAAVVTALAVAIVLLAAPREASAGVLPINCSTEVVKDWDVETGSELPEKPRSVKAEFYVVGGCFCSEENPTARLAGVLARYRDRTGSMRQVVDSIIDDYVAGTDEILEGGFTSDGQLRPALRRLLKLEKELHFVVDPKPGEKKVATDVYCVTTDYLKSWVQEAKLPAGRWTDPR